MSFLNFHTNSYISATVYNANSYITLGLPVVLVAKFYSWEITAHGCHVITSSPRASRPKLDFPGDLCNSATRLATENIFTKHDATDEIDRTCLSALSSQHGHWLTKYWIRRFARLHPRRIELANILSDWLKNPGKGTLDKIEKISRYLPRSLQLRFATGGPDVVCDLHTWQYCVTFWTI